MKFWVQSSGLVLGLVLSGAANSLGQNGNLYSRAPSAAAPVTVSGVVVNAVNGTPIPRALVQIGGRAVLTDHDGKFEFDQFTGNAVVALRQPLGAGSVQVTKPGYYASLEPNGDGGTYLSSSQMSEPIRLRLYPEALLTGTVTAPNGEPLRSIQVRAMRRVFDETGDRWYQAGFAQTNARGQFRIPAPAGEYRLETLYLASNPSDNDVVMPVSLPTNSSDSTSNSIRIRSGEEQNFDLHPAKGPAYVVSITLEPSTGYARIRARTGGVSFQVNPMSTGDGTYRLRLPSGSYTLHATRYGPDGQQVADTNVTVADHDVSGVVLRFSQTQALPVEIRVDPSTSDNAAAPNLMSLGLMLRSTDLNEDQNFAVFPQQQKDGVVTFHAPPGTYRLQARDAGQWFVESATYGDRDLLRQEMVIAAGAGGGPIELTVSNRTGSLGGTTSLEGVPCNCWVALIATTPNATPVINHIRSNSTNGYRMDLAPGTYQAIAFEKRYSADFANSAALAPFASHVRMVTIHAGDQATLDLDAVPEEEIAP